MKSDRCINNCFSNFTRIGHSKTHAPGFKTSQELLVGSPSCEVNRDPAVSTARIPKRATAPDSKVHGTNVGPIWGRHDPGGPHVGPMNLAVWGCTDESSREIRTSKDIFVSHRNCISHRCLMYTCQDSCTVVACAKVVCGCHFITFLSIWF